MPISRWGEANFLSHFETMKYFKSFSIILAIPCLMFFYNNCAKGLETDSKATVSPGDESLSGANQISMSFTRISSAGLSPFRVRVTLKTSQNKPLPGQQLQLNIPLGSVSAITDNQDGTYDFTVTPSVVGVYPIEASFQGVSVRREAVVASKLASGVGQPLAVPGNFVNTSGYEDGITITPDGNYLFVQYGPLYFSGVANFSSICQNPAYTFVDIFGCTGKANSNWVFDTIGPFSAPLRPNFPVGAISGGKLTHANLVIPGVANGIPIFPTVFYGFKKQPDGTFAEPFKLAFNDSRGTNGPFGLSFQMLSATTARFVVAWKNYFDDLGGDDSPNIYAGTATMGVDNNLGDVVYSGDAFASITPHISPVGFSSHVGVQGNPHLYYDNAGVVKSIWTDDEQSTHNLSVYRLTSGTYPNGTWQLTALPSKINTSASESQPFFTGTRLYLNRDTKIVYHDYLGSGGNDYNLDSSWGNEVVVLEGSPTFATGSIFGFGEPTIAKVDGKNLLYFVYVKVRGAGATAGSYDLDLDAGFVEVP